ncbi:hypothetical protein HY772_04880, partial [Candidatus Woesearchaeota archaeon]|nr:hypothetical protein [Candidatus Woesearchaeota archaeon]
SGTDAYNGVTGDTINLIDNLVGVLVQATVDDVWFNDAVLVTGDAQIMADQRDVNFVSTLDSAVAVNGDVEVFALNGMADFNDNVGANLALLKLTVNAKDTFFDGVGTLTAGSVNIGTGGLEVYGDQGTTTLNGNVISAGNVLINDTVVLTNNVTIDTATPATPDANVEITGTVNADDVLNLWDFTINAGTGNVTLRDSVGNDEAVRDFTVLSTGQTILNNNIVASRDILLGGATNIDLDSDVCNCS